MRARPALIGIVKQAPRGQGKAATAAKAAKAKVVKATVVDAPVVKRGPGGLRKNPAPAVGFDTSLDGIVAAVKSSEAEKNRYRQALQRIQEVLSQALGN